MTDEQFDRLISAIRAIAHGGVNAPSGLEDVAIAIAGRSNRDLAAAVSDVADALHEIASAIRDAGTDR